MCNAKQKIKTLFIRIEKWMNKRENKDPFRREKQSTVVTKFSWDPPSDVGWPEPSLDDEAPTSVRLRDEKKGGLDDDSLTEVTCWGGGEGGTHPAAALVLEKLHTAQLFCMVAASSMSTSYVSTEVVATKVESIACIF